MSAFAWLLILVVGIVVAFVAGRMTAPGTNRTKALEQERDAAASELRRYREDVSAHFEKTATLFNQVTGSYRSLYEHLADGSHKLGLGGDANLLHAEPERRKLDSQKPNAESSAESEEASVKAPGPAPAASAETGQGAADTQTGTEKAEQPAETARDKPQPSSENAQEEVPKQAGGAGQPQPEQEQKPPADFAEDAEASAEQGGAARREGSR